MNEDRKQFWLSAFHALAQVWRWLEPTADRIRVYDAALSRYSVDELALAITRLIERSTEKECPTPGQIREAVIECRRAGLGEARVMPLLTALAPRRLA